MGRITFGAMGQNFSYRDIPHSATHAFSALVQAYLSGDAGIKDFYQYSPDWAGIEQAIADREKHQVPRNILVDVITEQYERAGIELNEEQGLVTTNIASLLQINTFSICTAHQPNLFTGYLYFIYKILHTVKLASACKDRYPAYNFVPIYYMGAEDNDLEELGTFFYQEQKFTWDGNGQTGAVGRMNVTGIAQLIKDLKKVLGPPGNETNTLLKILETAYQPLNNIATSTQLLVHALLGAYGVVVLDADDARMKALFQPMMTAELFGTSSKEIIQPTLDALSQQYKIQASPRAINLFYLKDALRERIEQVGTDKWQVLNTAISWNQQQLEKEIAEYPERFSPNVILRGLYQESILPNIAFIGGGAELSYWMQLKTLFQHHQIFFPVLVLRQSIQMLHEVADKLQQQLGLTDDQLFLPLVDLEKLFAKQNAQHALSLSLPKEAKEALNKLKEQATRIDSTLEKSADATLHKIENLIAKLEQKMLRAEKRKHQVAFRKLQQLKQQLFPAEHLQERHENFMPYYAEYGAAWFDAVLQATMPFGDRFVLMSLP